MHERERSLYSHVIVLALFSFTLVACGDVVDQIAETRPTPLAGTSEVETQSASQPTPTQTVRIVEIRPTDTPVPPPVTPTTLPTFTPVPTATPEPEPEQPEEETPEAQEETKTPEPQATTLTATDAMVEIPAGTFTLGNDNSDPTEAPAQRMELPAFMIDVFEVTNNDFAAFVQATGFVTYREQQDSPQNWRWAFNGDKDNHPVVFVTFFDAQAYCEWIDKRLPTEFEWEKAARGPEGYLYPWGNEYDPTMLNGKDSGIRGTTAVGSYPPNGYGLFDMAGNVKEWIGSPYVAYPGSDYQDPFYSQDYRGIRGGGWFDEADFVLATNRNGGDPQITANDDIGFRCAK